MKIKVTSLIFAALSGLLILGCGKKSAVAPTALTTIELQQEWFPFAGFAGDISGAKRFASANGLNLKVRPGSEQVDPIKLVLSGTYPVGVVGSDLLVAAVAKGAPLVAIGVVNERSPTVFIVGESSGIAKPADFIGKKVGVLAGTNTERIYELMMKRTGVDRSRIKEIQIPFDLQTFLLGEYDVRPAFVYDETVSLEQKGRKYHLIKPEEFGVNFIGTVYFTSRSYLKDHRDEIVRLLATLSQGWKFALSNPAAAVKDLKEAYPDLDAAREERALELGRAYFVGANGEPLACDPAAWEKVIGGLEELGVIPAGKVKVTDVWDAGPLQSALRHEHKQ